MNATPMRFNAVTVLDDLSAARRERDRADWLIRLLVAYARTKVRPRPYRLADLAAASGMSISGVRTCYRTTDITAVHNLIHKASTRTEPG